MNESYISKTKAIKHIVTGGDSHLTNDTYPVIRKDNSCSIILGGKQYYTQSPLDEKTKAVYGIALFGNLFTAYYESTFASTRYMPADKKVKKLKIFDRSTLREIDSSECLTSCPVGEYPIYNISQVGTSVL